MKNRKLLLVASLVLAVSMSLGGTLAYLTDTDETVNVMTLGNVDIEQYENGLEENGFEHGQPINPAYYEGTEWTKAEKATGAIQKEINVKNVGSKEAYVRTLIAFEAGNLSKNDFDKYIHTAWDTEPQWIDGAIKVKDVNYYVAYVDYDVVAAGAETADSLQKIVMDKTTTNEIVAEFGPTYEVLALTQAIQTDNFPSKKIAWEEGYGEMNAANAANWFGGMAQVPVTTVSNVKELLAAVAKGGTVILSEDIVVTEEDLVPIPIPNKNYKTLFNIAGKEVVLDLNGNDLKVEGATDAVFFVTDGKLDIVGDGDIDTNCECYLVWARSDESTPSEVNIYGGNFISKHNPSDPNKCAVLIYGDAPYWGDASTIPYTHINIYGGSYSNALVNGQTYLNVKNFHTAKINVYGGLFENFDPSKDVSADDKDDIKVADGYKVVDLGAGKYMVVANDVTNVVGTNEQLQNAMKSGEKSVILAAGNYTMPEPDIRGKELTFNGTKDTVIDMTQVDARDQFVTGADLVFDGVTLNFGKANYMGLANCNSLTFKNCTINGLQFLYGPKVTFENCKLNSNGAEHCVWTYGAQNVTFNECEFTYSDRGINCYSDDDVPGGKQTVTFNNCTFKTDNTNSEGAVEINSCFFSVGIEVNLNGCTAPAHGEMAYVSPWDSTHGAKTTINIK